MAFYAALRAACTCVYLGAAVQLAGVVPPGAGGWLVAAALARAPQLAGMLVFAHILELYAMWGHVRRYRGPLAVSVVLTLLFGIGHWKALSDSAKGEEKED